MVLQLTSHNSLHPGNLFIWEPLRSTCRHIKPNLSPTLVLRHPFHDKSCHRISRQAVFKLNFHFLISVVAVNMTSQEKTCRLFGTEHAFTFDDARIDFVTDCHVTLVISGNLRVIVESEVYGKTSHVSCAEVHYLSLRIRICAGGNSMVRMLASHESRESRHRHSIGNLAVKPSPRAISKASTKVISKEVTKSSP